MTADATRGAVVGLVAGAAIAIGLAACAGKAASPAPPAAPEATSQSLLKRQEIGLLWSQIRGWRVDAGLPAEPPRRPDHPAIVAMSVEALRVCPEDPQPETATCQDVCKLKDAICDNADSICRIAGELDGDAWASGKCEDAKASCKEATETCCECAATEDSAAPAQPAAP
ncbi:MAG TPA: hypothetical protein VKZ63_11040 [Kofleriaceae bacterium]|nr:hypothetical protein [Kofleriaceae bacterium]